MIRQYVIGRNPFKRIAGRRLFRREAQGISRGSITVEAAVIAPLTVLLLAALITVTFYVHDRMWYRCAGHEAAISGNAPAEGGKSDAELAARRVAEQRIADQVMPGALPRCAVEVTQRATVVQYQKEKTGTWFGALAEYKTEVKVTRVRPERALRAAWTARREGM